MEHTMADPYLTRLRSLRLQQHLAAVCERQRLALLRNQSYRQEFLQLQAHMETSGLEMIRKMAWYGREIKSLLSLQEGNLSAGGDKQEGSSEQMPQAGRPSGIGTEAAVPREQYHPATAFLGCPTPAASATGGLGMQQEPSEPQGFGAESRRAGGEIVGSVERAAGHRDLAACEEGSRQLISSVPDPKPATPKEGQQQGGVPGSKPGLSNWWTGTEESSAELLVSSSAKEEVARSALSAQQERDRDAQAAEGSPLAPLSPPTAQQEPSDSSAPDRDTDMLQTHLSHHALLLEQHRARPPEGAAEVSDNLLALGEEAQDSQALQGERGDRSPAQGEESSCSFPSIPTEGRDGEPAGRAARLTGTGEPGRDLSDDSSKANDSQGMHSETSSSSDGVVVPFSRTEMQKERVTAIKSKAFWGESDDSNSEIEAALRPQTHSTHSGDFDDFYD